ncbi:cyclic nucleotide-binding protein [Vulcanimicrobium alpinum]|uniref:Cyclic nucleotide-binding protein n=1 Tax=Vulcanimicrobium alpinum TaxID=3016050 RepID=A0AAN2CAR1_UNVUL|nr:Crp/Fnr family transcriptional regulator [Vulcanimicrobium alpinum]BDE06867.1 cyclic nucleotide-binding protein [Vulcanimicrobium alpinum]
MAVAPAENNRFLGTLAPATRTLVESRMTVHGGAIGDVLQRVNERIDAIWFPLSGVVSTLRGLENDTNVEVDAAGPEGFLGIEALLGARVSADTWLVQSPGRFGRLDTRVFLDLLEPDPALREAVMRYVGAVLTLRGQWVACNARHTIEQRLAKWLLATRDRVGDDIQITQDVIAMMLGVRRASVVTVLGRFVDDGLVAHGYARVRMLDDARLASIACLCYERSVELLRRGVS